MTSPKTEAKLCILEATNKSILEVRDVLEEYRIKKGISMSNFIEIVATNVQQYRLMHVVLGKGEIR